MNPFDFASVVYNNKIYFGGYPNNEWFLKLKMENVKLFVNLTLEKEMTIKNLYPYFNNLNSFEYIHYPIIDNNIPESLSSFQSLIKELIIRIKNFKDYEKIYIHCKGGHGRSGMVVACLLCHLLNITPEKALLMTTLSHTYRPNLKLKYKNIKCPQIFIQKKFVIDNFCPIIIENNSLKNENKLLEVLTNFNIQPIILKKNQSLFMIDILLYIRDYIILNNKFFNHI
jgi:protein-tyrosine phosphatase